MVTPRGKLMVAGRLKGMIVDTSSGPVQPLNSSAKEAMATEIYSVSTMKLKVETSSKI